MPADTAFPEMRHPNLWPAPRLAFNTAIAAGTLTTDNTKDNCAESYMFMGVRSDGTLLFKNVFTRAYITCTPPMERRS